MPQRVGDVSGDALTGFVEKISRYANVARER
jgi:hypothetical protein